MRGLKWCLHLYNSCNQSRTFTGAWIEIDVNTFIKSGSSCRTFTGAWIEIFLFMIHDFSFRSHLHRCVDWNLTIIHLWSLYTVAPSQVRGLKLLFCSKKQPQGSRTFTGAWIEIITGYSTCYPVVVAPSQVRGLKFRNIVRLLISILSHLHRCVDWNLRASMIPTLPICRTFTGAWIEISAVWHIDHRK